MADIANLSIRIDSSQAKDATKSLDALARQSKESEKVAKDYISTLDKQSRLFGKTPAEIRRYESSLINLTSAQRKQADALLTSIERQERSEVMMRRVSMAAATAATAIAASAIVIGKATISSTMELEQSMARMQAVVRATGYAAGFTASQLEDMVQTMEGKTLFDDTDIRDAVSVLLTFKNVSGDAFGQTLTMASDLAAVMKTDLSSAVTMLGKALEDPEQGLTALSRVGVSFNDQQKDLIKGMAETGNQAGAMNEILKVLREQGFDKTAESMRKGLSGATKDVSDAWDDLLKVFGQTSLVQDGVAGFLGLVKSQLNDVKGVIESGNWFEKLTMFSPLRAAGRAAGFIDTPESAGSRSSEGRIKNPQAEAIAASNARIAAAESTLKKSKTGKTGKTGTGRSTKEQGPIDVFDNASFITSSKETAKFIKEQYDAINDLQGLMADDATRAADDYAAALERLVSDTPIAKTEELYKNISILDDAFMTGKIGAEQHAQAIENLTGSTKETAASAMDEMSSMAKRAGENIQDAFANFLFDPFSGGLDGMLGNFQKMLQKMAAEALASKAMSMLGSWGAANVGGGGIIGAVAGIASGMFGKGGTAAKANGGSVSGGGSYLIGEKGPELFTPATSGSVTSNKEMSRSVTVVNNFMLSQPTDRRTQEQVAAMAGASINAAMARGA